MLTIIYAEAFTRGLNGTAQGSGFDGCFAREQDGNRRKFITRPPPLSSFRKVNQINKLIRARWPVSRVLSRALPPLDGHSSGTSVAGRLARPTRESGAERRLGRLPGPILLSGLAPGGVCRAGAVTGTAVRSYRTVSPLPWLQAGDPAPPEAVSSLWHSPWGRPRRPLAATAHPWSPDFPPPGTPDRNPAHRQRPSGRLARGDKGPIGCPVKWRAPLAG
jgi:hypothetical protein